MHGRGPREWLAEADQVDRAVYTAVARTSTPLLDEAMRRVARAADYSRLSIAASAVLAAVGGPKGRSAAGSGLVAVGATSAIVNAIVKPLSRRRRPDTRAGRIPRARKVAMPASRSFPSGHAASAMAFASGAGQVLPIAGIPLHALAALVAYSRVHTGVHYPGDVVAGSLLGAVIADLTSSGSAALRRCRAGEALDSGRDG
jgi:membrane-associated phospholipid phosphatase